MRGTVGTICAVVALAIAPMGAASATTFGGLAPRSLRAIDQAGTSGAPTLLTCDDFGRAAPTGAALASRPVQLPANCGSATWTSHRGTWSISSGRLGAATANATATVNAGQTNMTAQATVLNGNAGGAIAGVAINHTGTSRVYLAGVLAGGTGVQLRLVTGATVTTLVTGTATVTATSTVTLRRNGSTVTVAVNGVTAITYTLTAGQVTTLSGGTRTGLYWAAGSTVRFTNMFATAP